MRILIAHPFGIGDVLFSLPLVYAIREADPKGYLGYLCNRRTEELVAAWPSCDQHFVFEKDEFRSAWRESKRTAIQSLLKVIRPLREQRFDVLLDLSLGWHYGFIAGLIGIKTRIGFDYKGRGRFLTHRVPIQGFHTQPVAGYYLQLLSPLGVPRPSCPRSSFELPLSVEDQLETFLRQNRIPPGEPLIGIVPGGGTSWGPYARFKQWPVEKFAQVADQVSSRYGARIVLIGDQQEASLCRGVAHHMTSGYHLAIQVPTLLVLAGLLKRCQVVIGNDSGPLHLAAAVGAKTVALFGPVDASVYGPMPLTVSGAAAGLPLHRVVVKGLACHPCYQGFRFPPCPWDSACLKQLETSQVLAAVTELLRNNGCT